MAMASHMLAEVQDTLTHTHRPSAGTCPKCLQLPWLGHAEASCQESQSITRNPSLKYELARTQTLHFETKCGHPNWWLSSLS